MLARCKALFHHPLWLCFRERRASNLFLTLASLLGNLLALSLEGVSIGLVWLSLGVLSGQEVTGVAHTLLSWLHLESSAKTLFPLLLLGAFSSQILRSLSTYLSQFLIVHLTGRMLTSLQYRIANHIIHLSFPSLLRYQTGDLIQHLSSNHQHLTTFITPVTQFFLSLCMLGLYVLILLFLSPLLTLYLMILMGLACLVQKYLLKTIASASRSYMHHVMAFSSYLTQAISGLRVIHLYHHHARVLRTIKTSAQKLSKEMIQLQKWYAFLTPTTEILSLLIVSSALLIWVCFLHTPSHSSLATHSLLTFFLVSYRLGTRLHTLVNSFGSILTENGFLSRITNLLHNQEDQLIDIQIKPAVRFENSIVFSGVSLRYPHQTAYALRTISFTLPRKKTIALVGSSGGGKSSVLDLLTRLYTPSEGVITVDECPLDQCDLASWRALFGVVSQEVFLFHDTIEANIRYGNPTASQEALLEAARLAGVAPFVDLLPEKYQTVVGERGVKLSGGERQRIALARALIRKPEILVLDEATSHLDSLSEQLIQHALDSLRGSMTIVVVAHRLSTVASADHILYLHAGSIQEEGSHEELLARKGHYYRAWTLQSTHEEKPIPPAFLEKSPRDEGRYSPDEAPPHRQAKAQGQ